MMPMVMMMSWQDEGLPHLFCYSQKATTTPNISYILHFSNIYYFSFNHPFSQKRKPMLSFTDTIRLVFKVHYDGTPINCLEAALTIFQKIL